MRPKYNEGIPLILNTLKMLKMTLEYTNSNRYCLKFIILLLLKNKLINYHGNKQDQINGKK